MSAPSKAQVKYTYEQKWGNDDPFVKRGYAQLPIVLFDYAHRLLIEPDEVCLICQIWKFKWTPSDEGPSEQKLAELMGKSCETVRRLLHHLVKAGFLKIERQRGDFGYYTHTVYNFTGLRAYLNECHYQDHPQERPISKKPLTLPVKPATTTQSRGVVKTQQKTREVTRKTAACLDAETLFPTTQSCVTLIESEKELNLKSDFNASLFQEQTEEEQEKNPPVNAAKGIMAKSELPFARDLRQNDVVHQAKMPQCLIPETSSQKIPENTSRAAPPDSFASLFQARKEQETPCRKLTTKQLTGIRTAAREQAKFDARYRGMDEDARYRELIKEAGIEL